MISHFVYPDTSFKIIAYKGSGYHLTVRVSDEEGCILVHEHSFSSYEETLAFQHKVVAKGQFMKRYWVSEEDFVEGLEALQ